MLKAFIHKPCSDNKKGCTRKYSVQPDFFLLQECENEGQKNFSQFVNFFFTILFQFDFLTNLPSFHAYE